MLKTNINAATRLIHDSSTKVPSHLPSILNFADIKNRHSSGALGAILKKGKTSKNITKNAKNSLLRLNRLGFLVESGA
jgi:hypothetical protein